MSQGLSCVSACKADRLGRKVSSLVQQDNHQMSGMLRSRGSLATSTEHRVDQGPGPQTFQCTPESPAHGQAARAANHFNMQMFPLQKHPGFGAEEAWPQASNTMWTRVRDSRLPSAHRDLRSWSSGPSCKAWCVVGGATFPPSSESTKMLWDALHTEVHPKAEHKIMHSWNHCVHRSAPKS